VSADGFPERAERALADRQLRANLGHATATIRRKRDAVVGELPEWEALRDAGAAIKDAALADLPRLLEELEVRVVKAGGVVHWARDGREACEIVASIARTHEVDEVVKVKSLATDEIGLNEALATAGVSAVETDLAELIVQLAHDRPSHIVVPAIHLNRNEIRDVFAASFADERLEAVPEALAEAARIHLREKLLSARMAVSGANFAVAETGTICVVESEGNGRFCLTLPDVLVTVMGIEKVVPTFRDLEVMLQLLPRSATGERMNPYTSLWHGVTPNDGPQEFHLVLLDNGRTSVLADEVGRAALRCIRCAACLNVCPVYERTGGHAYGSVYPGPIGAILTPQLHGLQQGRTLPWASSLCGACYEVCPVKIDIPRILVHLRQRIVEDGGAGVLGPAGMKAAAFVFRGSRRFRLAQRLARPLLRLPVGPLRGWLRSRAAPSIPEHGFRDWWTRRG
jgi:L-lactate dehydrogenase complex protein LldF